MNNTLKIVLLLLLGVVLVLIGYLFFSPERRQVTEEEIKTEEPPVKEIADSARYRVEFIAEWSEDIHPDYYETSAHFSPFVAYSHNNASGSLIFEVGGTSTPGVEDMAETGSPILLNEEIDELINSGLVFEKTQGTVFDSPGIEMSKLDFSKDYSYIMFVSMLAPSPDWFVSQETNLIQNGEWVERVELELVTYDAGTDSGETLTAKDIDTDPKEAITVFPDYLQNLGILVLTRIE